MCYTAMPAPQATQQGEQADESQKKIEKATHIKQIGWGYQFLCEYRMTLHMYSVCGAMFGRWSCDTQDT